MNDWRKRLLPIEGLIEPQDAEILANLAGQVPAKQSIVEIGSHTGLSTLWLAAGSRRGNGAHVTAVDPWPEPRPMTENSNDDPFGLGAEGVLARFRENLTNLGAWDKITALRMNSLDVAAGWLNPVGLIFIDALHGYGDVCNDLNAWLPHIAPGGWLAMHDWFDDPARTHESQVADAIRAVALPRYDWSEPEIGWNLWTARRA